ncbi:MAG: hypothetical protein CVT47_02590, partial [Thermoplasmata archaeon HGW-Thermoplasmata-2]
STSKTAFQLVENGLERLSDVIKLEAKTALKQQVEYAMGDLIKNYLSDCLEYKDGAYRRTEKWKQHHKRMEYVASKLKEWAGKVTYPPLEGFEPMPNDSEKQITN